MSIMHTSYFLYVSHPCVVNVSLTCQISVPTYLRRFSRISNMCTLFWCISLTPTSMHNSDFPRFTIQGLISYQMFWSDIRTTSFSTAWLFVRIFIDAWLAWLFWTQPFNPSQEGTACVFPVASGPDGSHGLQMMVKCLEGGHTETVRQVHWQADAGVQADTLPPWIAAVIMHADPYHTVSLCSIECSKITGPFVKFCLSPKVVFSTSIGHSALMWAIHQPLTCMHFDSIWGV